MQVATSRNACYATQLPKFEIAIPIKIVALPTTDTLTRCQLERVNTMLNKSCSKALTYAVLGALNSLGAFFLSDSDFYSDSSYFTRLKMNFQGANSGTGQWQHHVADSQLQCTQQQRPRINCTTPVCPLNLPLAEQRTTKAKF